MARFHYLAVEWMEWAGNDQPRRPTGPHLVRAMPDLSGKVHWGDGPSYRTFGKEDEVRIVKDYGIQKHDFWYAEAYALFMQDNPPASDADYKRSEGWLSPEGIFYPCPYGAHTNLAYDLCAYLGFVGDEEESNPEERLRLRGWVCVRLNHLGSDKMPTDEQVTAIRKLFGKLPDDASRIEKHCVAWFFDLWETDVLEAAVDEAVRRGVPEAFAAEIICHIETNPSGITSVNECAATIEKAYNSASGAGIYG